MPGPTSPPSGLIASRLETLLLDLGLGGRDGRGSFGVGEAAALLAVLERRGLGGAHTSALTVVGAAGRAAVGVVDATASDELGRVTGTDVLGSGVVGGHKGQRGNGDC